MPTTPTPAQDVPIGMAFHEHVQRRAEVARAETIGTRMHLGAKASACLKNLGTVLSLLDRVGSCWWGCQGGEHILERLAGRTTASALAALDLAAAGYYDEALNLARSVGEIANLSTLFLRDRGTLDEWSTATRAQRLRLFSPRAVRDRLTKLKMPLPISAERYAILCELATHPVPGVAPQAHNPLGMPALLQFQPAGYLVALNETAAATFVVAMALGGIAKVPDDVAQQLLVAGRELSESIGSANLLDGYPVLASQARAEISKLIASTPENQRSDTQAAILRMANEALVSQRQQLDAGQLGPESETPVG